MYANLLGVLIYATTTTFYPHSPPIDTIVYINIFMQFICLTTQYRNLHACFQLLLYNIYMQICVVQRAIQFQQQTYCLKTQKPSDIMINTNKCVLERIIALFFAKLVNHLYFSYAQTQCHINLCIKNLSIQNLFPFYYQEYYSIHENLINLS